MFSLKHDGVFSFLGGNLGDSRLVWCLRISMYTVVAIPIEDEDVSDAVEVQVEIVETEVEVEAEYGEVWEADAPKNVMDIVCGVMNAKKTSMCMRPLSCKYHTREMKRRVAGRSLDFDALLMASKVFKK